MTRGRRLPGRRRKPITDLVGIALIVTVVWAGSFVVTILTGNAAIFGQTSPVMLVVAGGLYSVGLRRDDDAA